MNNIKIISLLSLVLLLTAASTPVVSARFSTSEGLNAGLSIGDTVFIGERNVNFSAFSDPVLGSPVRMVRIDSGEWVDPISITNNIATIIRGNLGRYYPVYIDGTIDTSRYCWVGNAADSLGRMEIFISGTDITPPTNPTRPDKIPYRMEVQFLLPEHNLPLSEFQGSWYEYELQGQVTTSRITNTGGATISLTDLSANPATRNNAHSFRFSDQNVISPPGQVTVVFRMTLNSLNHELRYSFNVKEYPLNLQLSETTAERGGDLILTVEGMPYMSYDIRLPEPPAGENYPFFEEGGWYQKISDYHVRTYPGWDGTKQMKIHIPDTAPVTSYTIRATGFGAVQPVTRQFSIEQGKGITLIFDPPEEYQYAFGDAIDLEGTLANIKATQLIPIYLYVTGDNLPANGAPLTNPSQGVIDGDPSTFTITHFNPVLGIWGYSWDTSLFSADDGVYTVHANLEPVGHINSRYPGSPGSINGEVPPSHEYALTSPTIHAKFDEKTGGIFARGDYLYSWWYARGSPGTTGSGSSTGHMKWYIFGPNFKYADYNPSFPLNEDGSYGITLPRSFTYNLTPGDYFILYHHPGQNNQFDLLPENNLYYRGNVREFYYTGSSTPTITLGSLEARSAAYALVKALDLLNILDIYVMNTFTVQDPVIRIDNTGDVVIGDDLTVTGKTNLAGAGTSADGTDIHDTLILTITALDLYGQGKSNTVMKIQVDDAIPRSYDPLTGLRSFRFEPIETASWYPGLYQITVTCKDVNYKSTSTFELFSEKGQREERTDKSWSDPAIQTSPTTSSSSVINLEPSSTQQPVANETPGFGGYITIIAIAVYLLFIQRR